MHHRQSSLGQEQVPIMAKNEKKKAPSITKKASSQATASDEASKKRKNPGLGLYEIDSLFSEKKKQDRQAKEMASEAIKAAKKARNGARAPGSSSSSLRRGDLSVLEEKFGRGGGSSSASWVDDGLGGKFNREGYTGRVEDGVKVFKAHVLNKPGFGQSKDCPFDCECCFI
jgi:hypothetical protein